MKRTGNNRVAVVGWGRGMGHTGHMYLADAVITQAKEMKADPYFFVSKTIGKDDPIYPDEKVKIYQKVFPQYANIFTPEGNLNQALTDLAQLGYDGVVVVVGADQKNAFKYLENPNKEGVPVFQTMGFKKLRVISRQETRSKYANEEGPRATPMREVLMNSDATEETKFAVWRRDMPQALSDEEVLDLMHKAEQRMRAIPTKAKKLKEFITRIRPMLKEANTAQKLKVLRLIKESMVNEFAPGNGDDGLPYAEYVVYQCDPKDQFEFIGKPLYQTDSLGMAHKFAYEYYLRYRPKAFVVYQLHKEASRGNYGVKGESDEGVAEGAPIVVMPRADRLKKAEPTKVRYQGDIVPPTQPLSTEKRGVKGRSGQRPMPKYNDNLDEGMGDYITKKIDDFLDIPKISPQEVSRLMKQAPQNLPDDVAEKLVTNFMETEKAKRLAQQAAEANKTTVEKIVPYLTYFGRMFVDRWKSIPQRDRDNALKNLVHNIGRFLLFILEALLKGATKKEDVEEDKSKIIAQTVRDLKNPPKVMQHRSKRDQERDKELEYRNIAKRTNEDYLDEK